MISRVDFMSSIGTISPLNQGGTWGTIGINHDAHSEIFLKLNELVDAVNQLQSAPKIPPVLQEPTQGIDNKLMLEIIKENNAMWMKLLEFMKDMKMEKQDAHK